MDEKWDEKKIRSGNPPWEYKGYIYDPEYDFYDDNKKIIHDVIFPDGERRHLNALSPYLIWTKRDFMKWVDDGTPMDEQYLRMNQKGILI